MRGEKRKGLKNRHRARRGETIKSCTCKKREKSKVKSFMGGFREVNETDDGIPGV